MKKKTHKPRLDAIFINLVLGLMFTIPAFIFLFTSPIFELNSGINLNETIIILLMLLIFDKGFKHIFDFIAEIRGKRLGE